MKRWLIFIVLLSVLSITPYAEAQEMKYGYDEAYDEVVYAVASEQLSEEAYALYEQLKTIMQARQATFSVTYKGAWAQTQADFKQAVAAVLREDEYLAYDYLGYRYSSKGYDGAVTFTGTARYIQNAEQVTYVTKQIKKILPIIITPQMDDYAKVKAVHDYVVTNVAYDTSMNQAVNAPYFALTGGKTLCNGYAMLVHQMLQEANVPVRLISGVAGHGSKVENHAWNLVQVGGKWFHLDATWDDPIPDVAGRVLYNYYLLSDREIGKNHIWQNGGLNNHDAPYPSATTELFTHLVMTDREDVMLQFTNGTEIAKDEQQLRDYIREQFAKQQPNFTVFYQGQQSVSKVVAQATDGHQHNISYQTHPHRIPNTTQLTIKVGSYSGATQKQLRFATSLPMTTTVGDTLHVNIALVDGNATEDVTNKASIYANNTPTAATITLKQPGNMVINVVYNGQTLHHVVSVAPAPAPKVLAYPIEGIEPLPEKTTSNLMKQWVIAFSQPVKKYDQLRVLNQYGVEVAVTVQRQDNQVTVTPLVPYTKGEVYYLLLQGVESMTQTLPPQSMKFTIE